MDYGKEAYYKVSELEALIGADKQSATSVASVYDAELGGRQLVAKYQGKSALVSVTMNSEGSGRVRVYFEGVKVADAAAGGTAGFTFAASGSGALEVEADEGVTVEISAAAMGAGALVAPTSLALVADESGGTVYAAVYGEEGATLYRLEDGVFAPVCGLGDAEDIDICAEEGGITVIYCSRGKSSAFRQQDDKLYCADLGKSAAVSVTRDGEGLLAACYDGKRVTVMRLSDELRLLARTYCHASPTVEALEFVKRSPYAALAVSDGGKNLLRKLDDNGGAYVSLTCTVTGGAQ